MNDLLWKQLKDQLGYLHAHEREFLRFKHRTEWHIIWMWTAIVLLGLAVMILALH